MTAQRRYAALDSEGYLRSEHMPTTESLEDTMPHTHQEYATAAALATHEGTTHGMASHALDGALHSGTEVLPTPGQKNAIGGTQGTPGLSNRFVTDQDSRLSDARVATPHVHDYAAPGHGHTYAEVSHTHAHDHDPTYEPAGAVATHAATPHAAPAPVYADLGSISANTALALAGRDMVRVAPTANVTLTTTVPPAGHERVVRIDQTSTTSRTVTFGTGFKPVGTLLTGTTVARTFMVTFRSDGTNLYETARTAAMVT